MAYSFDYILYTFEGSGAVFYSTRIATETSNNALNSIIVYDSVISNNIAGKSGSAAYCI